MSPEQYEGEQVTARTDVFSLGMTMFYALTRKLPFADGETRPLKILSALGGDAVAPYVRLYAPLVSNKVAEIVANALQKEPENRYQSADNMLVEIKKAMALSGYALYDATLLYETSSVGGFGLKLHQRISTARINLGHEGGTRPLRVYHGALDPKFGLDRVKSTALAMSSSTVVIPIISQTTLSNRSNENVKTDWLLTNWQLLPLLQDDEHVVKACPVLLGECFEGVDDDLSSMTPLLLSLASSTSTGACKQLAQQTLHDIGYTEPSSSSLIEPSELLAWMIKDFQEKCRGHPLIKDLEQTQSAATIDRISSQIQTIFNQTAFQRPKVLISSKSVEAPRIETCLDKDKVQKQIRWALKYKKNIIIVVLENDGKTNGKSFDLKAARLKYSGTEWEPILDLAEARSATKDPTDTKLTINHGILYERKESDAKNMIADIFALKSAGSCESCSSLPEAPTEFGRTSSPPVDLSSALDLEPVAETDQDAANAMIHNEPGQWTFFLNHELQTSDQMVVLKLRLQTDNATVWQLDSMKVKTDKAIEEGVRNSECFILYLTSEAAGDGPAKPKPGEPPELRPSPSMEKLSDKSVSAAGDLASPKPAKAEVEAP